MNKRIVMPLLLLLFSIGSNAVTPESGTAASEETIRAIDDQERKAVLDRNYAALEHLWCDQFTVNSPGNTVVIGRRDVLAQVQKLANYSSFERKIEFVRIDGDIAIVMGAETVQPTGNVPLAGKTVERRFTNIWKKDGQTWCAIARHANVVSAR
jgi:ketosteroid isomerase-like protein